MRILSIVAVLLFAITSAGLTEEPSRDSVQTAPRYTADGRLIRPPLAEYRKWIFVGANLGLGYSEEVAATANRERLRSKASEDSPVGEFHNVYLDPAAFETFLKTGEFPDKTVLVMDVYKAGQKEPQGIVDRGHFEAGQKMIEVAVKNSNRPDGSKTDWAYYVFPDDQPAKAFADKDCYDCHKKHASTDNVWVQFYPILRDLNKAR
jgi:hypothetical protein